MAPPRGQYFTLLPPFLSHCRQPPGRRRFGGAAQSLFKQYSAVLERHPLPTKIVTSGIVCGSGDAACQAITLNDGGRERPADSGTPADRGGFDGGRCARFVVLGGALLAPVLHVWYGRLGVWIPGGNPMAVVKRLALDQLFFAPLFIPTFMSSLMILEKGSSCTSAVIVERLKLSWADAVLLNWTLWVPANGINFAFIPGRYQVLFANCVGFVWNTALSFQATKES